MVERLLEAAGPGPEIPEDGPARIKNAIRASWREGVAERTRRRRQLWSAGAAAAAALIVAALFLPMDRQLGPPPPQQHMTVAVVAGTLEVTPPGGTAAMLTSENVGAELASGSLVRTRDSDRSAIWLSNGRSLRLDHDTALRLDSELSVSLDAGAVYLSSSGDAARGFEVRTAFGTARDIGTRFEVRRGTERLDVKVREGLVSLTRGEDEYRITHGVVLTVDSEGAVTTGSIAPDDPVWAWTTEIAPDFEIEGRSVLAFLDWVSSETGRSVRFSDAEVERFAATTLLHGTIEGLPPSETPAAVLPTCGLVAEEEPGTLLIRRLANGEEGG